jgi:hypothetical protein
MSKYTWRTNGSISSQVGLLRMSPYISTSAVNSSKGCVFRTLFYAYMSSRFPKTELCLVGYTCLWITQWQHVYKSKGELVNVVNEQDVGHPNTQERILF